MNLPKLPEPDLGFAHKSYSPESVRAIQEEAYRAGMAAAGPCMACALPARLEALESALRQARFALTNARAGFHLAYEAAEKGFIDEAMLHMGHHSAQPASVISAINDLLKD